MRVLLLSFGPTSLLSFSGVVHGMGAVPHVDVLACIPFAGSADAVRRLAEALPGSDAVVVMSEREAMRLHAENTRLTRKFLSRFLMAPLFRKKAVAKFRALFPGNSYDEIYYVHDVSGARVLSLAAHAWPNARRVCLGDGFGIFYARESV